MRIARKGNIWTAWTSADGNKWELGGYHVKAAPQKMDVGLFISAIQQDAHEYYKAKVSALSVQPGLPDECVPPPPVAAKNTAGDRLSSVAMARSDENVVVVRSTSNGLMRTADGGKTWSAINGNLAGAANAVRGVAVHPANPAVMLRAAGRVVGGTWQGGLWKTADAGRTWGKLDFQGDFDGVGPSALCGEVVAFDLKNPDTIYVGTESKGCFKSADGGATWTSLGVVGKRITSVVVWPWDYVNPVAGRGVSHLCVTTCPDKWMPLLGRGKPAITAAGDKARSYVSLRGAVKTCFCTIAGALKTRRNPIKTSPGAIVGTIRPSFCAFGRHSKTPLGAIKTPSCALSRRSKTPLCAIKTPFCSLGARSADVPKPIARPAKLSATRQPARGDKP